MFLYGIPYKIYANYTVNSKLSCDWSRNNCKTLKNCYWSLLKSWYQKSKISVNAQKTSENLKYGQKVYVDYKETN